MFDYNKKTKRNFFGGLADKKEDILDLDVFNVEDEEKQKAGVKAHKDVVDYIRHDFARNAYPALLCSLVALVFMVICVFVMTKSGDNAGLVLTAVAVCSALWAVAGVAYAIASLFEKKRNYTLSFISLGLGGALVFMWLIIMGKR